ncbi:hypothetical protein [Microcoleus sp. EPA2]
MLQRHWLDKLAEEAPEFNSGICWIPKALGQQPSASWVDRSFLSN